MSRLRFERDASIDSTAPPCCPRRWNAASLAPRVFGSLLAVHLACNAGKGDEGTSLPTDADPPTPPAVSSTTLADPVRLPWAPAPPNEGDSDPKGGRHTRADDWAVDVDCSHGDERTRRQLAAGFRRCYERAAAAVDAAEPMRGRLEVVVGGSGAHSNSPEVEAAEGRGLSASLVSCVTARAATADWSAVGAGEKVRISARFGKRD
jgi:hypothetical protein